MSDAEYDFRDRIAIVTGGGNGIGAAIARRLADEGAAHVALFDLDLESARSVADEIGGTAMRVDVADENNLRSSIAAVRESHGRVDICCSNAGLQAVGGPETPDADWDRLWRVNTLSNVFAARELLPHYLERGEGVFLQTASAGGLLCEIGSASYTVTKAGAIAFAEWLSVNHRRLGVRVSVLCPAGVTTDFLDHGDPAHSFLHAHAIPPEDVAAAAIEGMRRGTFLIVPEEHRQLLDFYAEKSKDYDRYLHLFSRIAQKMQRMRRKASENG